MYLSAASMYAMLQLRVAGKQLKVVTICVIFSARVTGK